MENGNEQQTDQSGNGIGSAENDAGNGAGGNDLSIDEARAIVAGLAGKRGKRSAIERRALDLVGNEPGDPSAEFGGATAGSGGNGDGIRREKGSARKAGQGAPLASSVTLLAKKIQGLHQITGMALGLPELMLDDTEARELADAIQIVSKEYGVKISGKGAAAFNLLLTAGMIYGPKGYAIYSRSKSGSVSKAPPAMPSATQAAAATMKTAAPKAAAFNPMGAVGKPDWAN